ncbi:MAG TPA: exodeoxyribonuclease III [Burkholderiales bacterium]|nr:exodeoxyribonuclease III [Burkholderiales bacterium]
MRIATWNVNSLKVRLPHVVDWLAKHQPDVLCLQETKTEDAKFPLEPIAQTGYQVVFSGQKTYNGVALLSRNAPTEVVAGIPGFADEQKRVLAATYGDTRVICTYIPNGESVESDKYQYKLRWLTALTEWLRTELQKYPRLALLGDYNIAPEDRDVWDPKVWEGKVLCSAPEREALAKLIALGMKDSFRLFDQPERSFTWWDYRMNAFRRKFGLRIDHILLSNALAVDCTACTIDIEPRKLERPSDHTPVFADLQ